MEDESFESSEESDGHSSEENSSLDSQNRSQYKYCKRKKLLKKLFNWSFYLSAKGMSLMP